MQPISSRKTQLPTCSIVRCAGMVRKTWTATAMLPSRRSQKIAVVQAGSSRNCTMSEIGLCFIGRTPQSNPCKLSCGSPRSKSRAVIVWCSDRALQSPPRLDDTSNGPGLGGRAAREVRRLCLEDFADGSEPGIEQVIPHDAEGLQRQIGIAGDAVFRQRVMAEQPGPCRPLMIGAVAVPRGAGMVRLVVGFAGRER